MSPAPTPEVHSTLTSLGASASTGSPVSGSMAKSGLLRAIACTRRWGQVLACSRSSELDSRAVQAEAISTAAVTLQTSQAISPTQTGWLRQQHAQRPQPPVGRWCTTAVGTAINILQYIYSTDRHVLAIMQADLCRAHPYNKKKSYPYISFKPNMSCLNTRMKWYCLP
jgi:hypothetical protein